MVQLYGNSGTQSAKNKISLQDVFNRVPKLQSRVLQEEITLTFENGSLGIIADWKSGLITKVNAGSQSEHRVRTGWRITKVSDRQYTEELLAAAVAGTAPYSISFFIGEAGDYGKVKDDVWELVEATVKWKFPEYISWENARRQAEKEGGEARAEELQEKMETIIRLLTEISTNAIKKDPSSEWAIRSLEVLCDNSLYDKQVLYPSNHNQMRRRDEGANFLKGVAATAFQELGGYIIFTKFDGVDAAAMSALVRLLRSLCRNMNEGLADCPQPFASCQAAATRISGMQPAELISSREYLQATLEVLFELTLHSLEPECREARSAVESAWWALVSEGIRSQNLLARRACAEFLGKANNRSLMSSYPEGYPFAVDMARLSAWLRQDNIFEELFGSRQDLRVLEDMDLYAFCEESQEGVRTLLAGMQPALGQEVLAQKFFSFALRNGINPSRFGRDVIVIELCNWINPLLREGNSDVLAFFTRFISKSCGLEKEGRSLGEHRMIAFVADKAMNELTFTLGEALLSPCVSRDQRIELEAALFSIRMGQHKKRDYHKCQEARDRLVQRIATEVDDVATAIAKAEASSTKAAPLRREVLWTLLRILEIYPFEVSKDRIEEHGTISRQEIVAKLVEGELISSGAPLTDQIWKELVHILPDMTSAEAVEDIELRLRVMCYLYRCSKSLHILPSKLSEMVTVLKGSADGWRYICYLLRIATPAGASEKESFPVFTDETVARSLELLEELALAENGLGMSGFFCLQQAMLLVNNDRLLELVSNASNQIAAARTIVVGEVQPKEQADHWKLKGDTVVGLWVKVQEASRYNHNYTAQTQGDYKIARIGKYDSIADMYDLEYIDETRGEFKLRSDMREWDYVPALLEQSPLAPSVSRCRDVQQLAGIRGLWACALGGEADGDSAAADLAAALLLSLYILHPQALLERLHQELQTQRTPMVVTRCLGTLKTLLDQLPPALPRRHLGTGFPCQLLVHVFEWKKIQYKRQDGGLFLKEELRRVQTKEEKDRPPGPLQLTAKNHSQFIVKDFLQQIINYMNENYRGYWDSVDLFANGMQLEPHSRHTLEEWDLKPNTLIKVEQRLRESREREPYEGIMDTLGKEGEWPETLLGLLETSVGTETLSPANRALCWELLIGLSTYKALEEKVQQPELHAWGELLDRKYIWHSIYYVRLIEDWCSRARPREKEVWTKAFQNAGGWQALLKLFYEAFNEPLGDFERSALLPVLLKIVLTAFSRCNDGEEVDLKSACTMANAAVSSSQWLLQSSLKETSWQQLRLRYAAVESLKILDSVTRGSALPMSILDEHTLPFLVKLVEIAESTTDNRDLEDEIQNCVKRVIRTLSARADCAKRLLQRLAQALRAVADKHAGKKGGSAEKLCKTICNIMKECDKKVLKEESSALLEVAVDVVLESKAEIESLYILISTLFRDDDSGASKSILSEDIVQKFAERLLRCVLPETNDDIGQEDTREAAANLLIQLLRAGLVKAQRKIQARVFSYLTMIQAPDTWNFEPTTPEEPYTELNAPRNNTGHVGLVNRGSTCYMNSTVQQLFWSEPFRHAIKKSSPPLAVAGDKPEPLPSPGDRKSPSPTKATTNTSPTSEAYDDDDSDTKVTSKPRDVGLQFQRAFAFLEDCQQGLYNTDDLVDACSCLNLEYSVRSQNDASEFLDKVCDKLDEVCDAKPSQVLTIKTAKEKRCHHCDLRTKSVEESIIRLQINTLAPTLEECLQNIVQEESMVGDNRVECDNCKEKRDTSYQTYFTHLPQIMVVHLGRMSFDYETLQRVKLNDYVKFPLKLNMSQYTEDAIVHGHQKVPGCAYELQGVLVHQGFAGAGHYYSFVQDHSGKWFKFNDDCVSPFDTDDLEHECFGGSNGRHEKSNNAYMLFYRCKEASPYSTQAAAPVDTIHRSLSDTLRVDSGDDPPPPKLERCITATTAKNSEELQQKMQKWKQDQLRRSLKEEIININGQLHRHSVVFSGGSLRFLYDLVESLWGQIALAGSSEESVESKTAQVELCRLSALAFFEVICHARKVDYKDLGLWLELFQKQSESLHARSWLISILSGQPEQLLGRRTCSWLASAILQCDRNDKCEFAARVAAYVAERHRQGDGDLNAFWESIIGYIPRIRRPEAMKYFGKLWLFCLQSESLRPLLIQYRSKGDLSLASLLLHAFCGVKFSPLDAPPAPPLTGDREHPVWWMYPCYIELLACAKDLLQDEAIAKSEQVVRDERFWKALAISNPDEFEDDGPFRALFPSDDSVVHNVGQTLVERMRPSGEEHKWYAEHYPRALAYVLTCGGEEKVLPRLALLSQVAQHILTNAKHAAAYSNVGTGYYSNNQWNQGQKSFKGPKNPDALQLIRLLQVVAMLDRPLDDTWSWAAEWLRQVMLPTEKWKWGLPMDEVQILAKKFSPQQEISKKDSIRVSGAGDTHVNGVYTASEEDGETLNFRHEKDEELMLSSSSPTHSTMVRLWKIHDATKTYYMCTTYIVDSALPPLTKWQAREGKLPVPTLTVLSGSPTAQVEEGSPLRVNTCFEPLEAMGIDNDDIYDFDDCASDKAGSGGSLSSTANMMDVDDDDNGTWPNEYDHESF